MLFASHIYCGDCYWSSTFDLVSGLPKAMGMGEVHVNCFEWRTRTRETDLVKEKKLSWRHQVVCKLKSHKRKFGLGEANQRPESYETEEKYRSFMAAT